MNKRHAISEYVNDLPLKKSLCMGFHPNDVYEVVRTIASMYNEVLTEAYDENNELRERLERAARPNGQRLLDLESYSIPKKAEVLPECDDDEIKAEQGDKEQSDKEERSTVKAVKKLRREELIELLIRQNKENQKLSERIAELEGNVEAYKEKLSDKQIMINKAGTIAEAAFMLNGVFESTQNAAQQYLDNLQSLCEREEMNCRQKEREAEEYAERLLSNAKQQSDEMVRSTEDRCSAIKVIATERSRAMREEAEQYCENLERETREECLRQRLEAEEQCNALSEKAKQVTEDRWEALVDRLEELYRKHPGLREQVSETEENEQL